MNQLQVLAEELRLETLRIVMAGSAGHIGGDFSMAELLAALYGKHLRVTPQTADDPNRDYFVLSKGHCVEAYYAALCAAGFLDVKEVEQRYFQFGSPYIGHPNNHLPGIEMNSGSLGHGLSVCVGLALAARMDARESRVYTILGDGELAEGSVWEAAMAAGHYRLSNLCAMIDRNRLQISGPTEQVMAQDPLADRWRSFGWNVLEIDGNDASAVDEALTQAAVWKDGPTMILANTIKGCGSALLENKAPWHHKVPTKEEAAQIRAELEQRKEAAEHAL